MLLDRDQLLTDEIPTRADLIFEETDASGLTARE